MSRAVYVCVALLVVASASVACSICAGSFATRTTLPEKHSQAGCVVAGVLKNAKPSADDLGGTTELHIATVLKPGKLLGTTAVILLPKYYPTIASTPPSYLAFFDETDGELRLNFGTATTPELTAYIRAIAKFTPRERTAQLAVAFDHLEAADEAIAAEAFLEFALASDADIANAKAIYRPKKLRDWLNSTGTKTERLGLYAILLALTGEADDRRLFQAWTTQERFAGQLSGVLAGAVLLDSASGWAEVRRLLHDAKKPFEQRLSALQAVRFLQATRGVEQRIPIMDCLAPLCADVDFADLVMDDLRRWAWWDHTEAIIAQYKATSPRGLKRSILRYALSSPDRPCAAFVATVRAGEPEVVAKAEASLRN